MKKIALVGVISEKILLIRGKRVMLDADLAQLYEVSTKRLNEQVKRNIRRFPEDFMFRLTVAEEASLRSQIATSNRGGRRYLPYVFTQEGIAMLSGVLNSKRAIWANIQIMRAFVQLRKMLLSNDDLRRKIEAMEKKYDKQFAIVFEAIRELLSPPKKTRAIGFYI